MTDKEIIEGLIKKDENITQEFFFKQSRNLLNSIITDVFGYGNRPEYDELVSELYLYLMDNDAARLKSFGYRCSVYTWLKTLTTRFFIRIKERGMVIDNESREPLYNNENHRPQSEGEDYAYEFVIIDNNAKEDLERLLAAMPNQRYASVLKRLIIIGMSPEELAQEMNITTANIYNIKQRAMKQLTEVALKDIHYYGKQ